MADRIISLDAEYYDKLSYYFPNVEIKDPFVKNVMLYALEKHHFKRCSYADKTYGFHLEQVYTIATEHLYELKYEEDQPIVLAGAWGHDIKEDCGISFNELLRDLKRYGTEKQAWKTANIIYNVSNEEGRHRKEKLLKTLIKTMNDPLAIYDKLCDRLANTQYSKTSGHSLYATYSMEYPVFRYALKGELYPDLWNRLDQAYS